MNDTSVRVRVPASTSNCGSGFDTLGMALNLYNEVALTCESGAQVRAASGAPCAALAMVEEAGRVFFRRAGIGPFGFSYAVTGDVPLARGLGSSVTVRAGVAAGLNRLAGDPLSRDGLVGLVTELEGHPDNASAAILGGFCVARFHPGSGAYVDAVRVDVGEELAVVVLAPELEVLTDKSRSVLPRELPFFDAVKSINSAAYLASVFVSGNYERLRGSVFDLVHEPYRLKEMPFMRDAIDAGVAAGAYTGWLSGSGSSVLCVCNQADSKAVGRAMAALLSERKIPHCVHSLRADNAGLQIL